MLHIYCFPFHALHYTDSSKAALLPHSLVLLRTVLAD